MKLSKEEIRTVWITAFAVASAKAPENLNQCERIQFATFAANQAIYDLKVVVEDFDEGDLLAP
jgi:hypothetical protein